MFPPMLRTFSLILAVGCAGFLAAAQPRYSVAADAAKGPGSPRIIVLRDGTAGVEAAVAPSEGGEMTSLRVRIGGAWTELVYRARDYAEAPGFRGKAQFIWPAAGGQFPAGKTPKSSCEDGTYPVAGRTYPMPCHGFANKLPWSEAGHSADGGGARAVVELRDSEQTRAYYPFGFRVRAAYELAGGRLTITYTIFAAEANSGPMPFSIGNHMSFRVPFLDGTEAADMLFETPSSVQLLRDAHGLLSGETRARSFARPERLGDFDASVALPMAGYTGEAYARLVDPRGLALGIRQRASTAVPEPLVRFNVFGGPKQGFFCPEPWFGLQNSLNVGKGLVLLAPGKSWQWTVELSPEAVKAAGK